MQNRPKKAVLLLLWVNIVIIAAFGILYGIIYSLKTEYSPDLVKKQWDSELYSYSRISLYTDKAHGFDTMGIYSMQQAITDKLRESSIKEDDTPGRLWVDCASGEAPLTVFNGAKSCEVTATGTFGDFFLFHPEKLLSGSYYTDEDINIDTVIIDKQCSWQLFGAIDTAGMSVTINGKLFRISAVVDTPEKENDKIAYGSTPRIYMHYEMLRSINESAVMTAYEVCIPNAVKDYAKGVITEINTIPAESSSVIDQTDRFGIVTLFRSFKNIPESVMITTGISYPWFENRIRAAEITARILSGPAVMILIVPLISAVYVLFALVKLIGRGAASIKKKAEDSYQKKISEAYYSKRK